MAIGTRPIRFMFALVLVAGETKRSSSRQPLEGDRLVASGTAARNMRLRRRVRLDGRHLMARSAVALGRVMILVTRLTVEIRNRLESESFSMARRTVERHVRIMGEHEGAILVVRPDR